MVIDSHHHLWRYTADEFGWIADDCLRPDFMRGLRRMRGTGLVYDILVFQRQLANATRFVDGLVAPLSESERQAILGATAARVYGISP